MLLAIGLASTNGRSKQAKPVLTYISHYEGMDPGLPFLTGARIRVKLPEGDLGPRALTCVGHKIYAANYYSDTLSVIDMDALGSGELGGKGSRREPPSLRYGGSSALPYVESIPLGPKSNVDAGRKTLKLAGAVPGAPAGPLSQMDVVRKGDFYFHDATLCLQGWQSCSSCHPGDARADGFNWDLLNDGIGNPKSTRSLLLAHRTPPAMFSGVRTNAEAAVRAGIKFILFTEQPEEVPAAIDKYLKSLRPVPGPHLVHGKFSQSAKRGEKIFHQAGCADCHVPGLFTDLHPHDVGTRRTFDNPTDKFYTPTLIEVWRTAPYLHDGSAATMRDVLTTRNPNGEHGDTRNLSMQEMDDLCEYVLSL
jgi:hypothetical protein